MPGIAVFLETTKGRVRDATLEALGVASSLKETVGGPVTGVLIGKDLGTLSEETLRYGLDEVFKVEDDQLSPYRAEPFTRVLEAYVQEKNPEILFFPGTSLGKDLAPRLAARLGVGLASEVIKVQYENGKFLFERTLYSNKVFGLFEILSSPKLVLLRPTVFEAAKKNSSGSGKVDSLSVSLQETDFRVKHLGVLEKKTEEIDVREADVIVSGGRAVRGPEGFNPLQELVQVMNELGVGKVALGASRAAVDAGWIEHAHQVGQTGKAVSPRLYMAFGISGAIQHLAGMRTSKVIVAINKDKDAPIFRLADYGLVEDIFKVVPVLIEELKKLYGGS